MLVYVWVARAPCVHCTWPMYGLHVWYAPPDTFSCRAARTCVWRGNARDGIQVFWCSEVQLANSKLIWARIMCGSSGNPCEWIHLHSIWWISAVLWQRTGHVLFRLIVAVWNDAPPLRRTPPKMTEKNECPSAQQGGYRQHYMFTTASKSRNHEWDDVSFAVAYNNLQRSP